MNKDGRLVTVLLRYPSLKFLDIFQENRYSIHHISL
jgi:hypothetical protein